MGVTKFLLIPDWEKVSPLSIDRDRILGFTEEQYDQIVKSGKIYNAWMKFVCYLILNGLKCEKDNYNLYIPNKEDPVIKVITYTNSGKLSLLYKSRVDQNSWSTMTIFDDILEMKDPDYQKIMDKIKYEYDINAIRRSPIGYFRPFFERCCCNDYSKKKYIDDVDELIEHAWREDLDSREKVVDLIKRFVKEK